MTKTVRTRFAPSPTGALHAGTVRTALFAWLTARHAGGQFILRIEDTDKAREVESGTRNIIEALKYLGLDWDEGPDAGGSHEPYIQSERLPIYLEWAQKLLDNGRAYADPTDEAKLNELREGAKAVKKPFLYREHRPENPPKWEAGMPIRFKSEPRAYEWHDEVMGDLSAGPEVIDDFILVKADGFPTYNFAHIIDDHLMEITHLMRSQEFISSMPNFLNLYDALELERPVFATMPLVLPEEGGKKLSKRLGAKQLLDYQKMGILPAALMNALATTGWSDGTEQEIFSKDELIAKFELSRVQKGSARFDEKRLIYLNGHYIRELPIDELLKLAEDYWPESAKKADDAYKKKVLALVQERLKYFDELWLLVKPFFEEPADRDILELYENPVDKQLAKQPVDYKQLLSAVIDELKESDFSAEDLQKRLNQLLEELDSKPAILFPVIRIAVTGSASSPEMAGTLAVLGKEKSLARLQGALKLLAVSR